MEKQKDEMSPHSLSTEAQRSQIDLKKSVLKAEIFTIAAKLKELMCTQFEVGVCALSRVEGLRASQDLDYSIQARWRLF